MLLPDTKTLTSRGYERLSQARNPGKIALIYSGITVGVAIMVTIIQYLLDGQMAQAGGLHNIGSRSILSSFLVFLPLIQTAVFMCLDLGFRNAMLRISRGQYASPNSLRLGFDRFWLLLRALLLQMVVYFGICFSCFYLAFILFAISPFSEGAMSILTPMVTDSGILDNGTLTIDAATEMALMRSLLPFFVLYLITIVVLGAPIYYRYRMVNYLVIDHPGMGAFKILKKSRAMMRGNCLRLLKLDLRFWWYYLMLALASLVAYGDVILAMFGRSLPLPDAVNYFLFYFLYLISLFAIYYGVKSGVETTYAAAYDSLCEKEDTGGVVLGNIFQL